ncbi:glycosyltransferase family 2 protein [Bifidobacterium olomucense]|uniref:Glycosyltransferase n=1 Tax=Bifidobacterium olomucense TaxID=2675324 RepID=A0A7Y0EZ99_9BIFI|nr:glycosyltransferase family 2 protein [Bifidobacterium sp. DSM 109959]NMM99119.1 glycosyltransferase [Bifidobacterium sp. DSM 109959]
MVDISVIVPFYRGNKYINGLLDNIGRNAKKATDAEIEVLLINDSPDYSLIFDTKYVKDFKLEVITNKQNLGIHGTRVEGLKHAKGEYVLFLDQDDELTDDAIFSQYNNIHDYDISVCNGLVEMENHKSKLLFKNKKQQNRIKDIKYYFYIGNMITSPGMALIKKESIPDEWIENNLISNGADDWLLWILMIMNHSKIKINPDTLYIHKYTGENLSNNTLKMLDSSEEALKIIENKNKNYSNLVRIHKRRLRMRHFEKNIFFKIGLYLINVDILFILLKWKA